MNSNRWASRLCFGFVCIAGLLFCLTGRCQPAPERPSEGNFFDALLEKDTNTVFKLLDQNTNLVRASYSGRLPLHIAAQKGFTPIVAKLLKAGADINEENDSLDTGNCHLTALDIAVWYYQPEVCRLLLESGANPNLIGYHEGTALRLAFLYNRTEMAGWLLDHGANPFLKNDSTYYDPTPMDAALAHGYGNLVPRMLETLPRFTASQIRTNVPRSGEPFNHWPPKDAKEIFAERSGNWLSAAAQHGEYEAVKALFRAGATISDPNPDSLTLMQAFAVATAAAERGLPGTQSQLQAAQEELKRDYIPNAEARFVAERRARAEALSRTVQTSAPEWRGKILNLLIQHGAHYDALAATALNDTNQITRLLAARINVTQSRDFAGNTPLHWAVNTDRPQMVIFWINAGASLAATNAAGQTALHLAAANGKTEFVKALLSAHAPTDVLDTNGWTPLDAAIQNKQSDCIHLLLPENPAAGHPERGLSMSLHEAAAAGNVASLAAILETETNLEARNELGLTPLQVAVTKGHLAAAALLVDKGANVSVCDPAGNGLLHQILLQEQLTIYDRPPTNWLERVGQDPGKKLYVQYLTVGQYEQGPNPLLQAAGFLLACGADATAKNKAGDTPMQLIVDQKTGRGVFFFDNDREKHLQLLSVHGGNVDERDADGNTALHRLCSGYYDADKVDSMASLIASGANVNATNNLGQTPLHVASGKITMWDDNDPPVNNPFQLLIYKNADVNARDNQGRTPLHVISISDSMFKDQATRLLISAGANPNLQDRDGMTPLHLVASSGLAFSEGVVQGLLDSGAKPNIQDKNGRTPAHLFLMGPWPWSSSGDCLKDLAAAKADFSIKDDQGKTPLHYLAALGSESPLFFIRGIDRIFVDAKVDFQANDNDGDTAAIIAAKTGTKDVFDWLVKQGADLDITNNQGETARLLMAHKKDSFPRSGPGNAETDIFQAAREGNIDAATSLLKADPALVNQTNQYLQTPLRLAVTQHQTNMVNFLETRGASWDEGSAVMAGRTDVLQTILKQNPSAVASKVLGRGLIHMAAASGDLSTVKILIEANCDLQSGDDRGLSPLGYALINKHQDVRELLLQHGARENFFDAVYANDLQTATVLLAKDKSLAKASDGEKFSAIDIAVAAGYTDILKLLLKNGAPIASAGRSPILLAVFYNQADALALLIRAGAKVDQIDQLGLAPLHWAAIRGATEAADLLLKHKADANQVVSQAEHSPGFMMGPDRGTIVGDTPLHLAALCGETNMVQLLLKSGADVNALNVRQQTPLDLANGMPPRNLFGIVMIQRGMMGLLEPLGVNPTPVNQLQSNWVGRKSSADLLRAAGGKHSQNNQPFGGRWGPP
jgi:ankyrin repeat protein